MEIQSMSSAELAEVNRNVAEYNARIRSEQQRLPQQIMGRDEFLKLLLTQLANQDPTSPIEDREFIAQMAQFSSLEQMTNMANDFSRLARVLMGNEATSVLGKSVELFDGETLVQGSVQAVLREDIPRILVGGNYYHWDQVTKIYNEGEQNI